MKNLLLLLLISIAITVQASPQLDPYGGLAGAVCDVLPAPGYTGSQLSGVTLTQAITGSTIAQPISVSSTAGITTATHLDIDPGSTTPIQVSGESVGAPSGSPPAVKYTITLGHSSVVQGSVVIQANGVTVATESYGALVSTPAIGTIVGHVSPLLDSTQTFVSFTSSTTLATPVTVNYQYLSTEVVLPAKIIDATHLSAVVQNNHPSGASLLYGYFRTAEVGDRWALCDPLNHVFYHAGLFNFLGEPYQPYSSTHPGGTNIYGMLSVNTTLTADASVGATSIDVASTSNIIPPVSAAAAWGGSAGKSYQRFQIGSSTAGDYESASVASIAGSTVTLKSALTKNHSAGAPVSCCANSVLLGGKYGNDNANGQAEFPYMVQRLKTYGFNAHLTLADNSYAAAGWTQGAGVQQLWDLPDHSNPFKMPYTGSTIESHAGMVGNTLGFVPASSGHNYATGLGTLLSSYKWIDTVGGKQHMDWFDHNASCVIPGTATASYCFLNWMLNLFSWQVENPWLYAVEQDQGDYMPQWGPVDDFATSATGGTHQFESQLVLVSPPFLSLSSASAYPAQKYGVFPVSPDAQGNPANTNYTKLAYSQYVQGKLDPLNFPATGTTNISSIACSGSNAVVMLALPSWLSSNFASWEVENPFAVGMLVTITGTTYFNTTAGSPASVTAANGNAVTLTYPVSPCPNLAEATGNISEGPGYANVAALDTSWNAPAPGMGGYDTFGTDGSSATGESLGTTDGSTATFAMTAAHTGIDPMSFQIVASKGSVSKVIAGDGGGSVPSGTLYSPTNSTANPGTISAGCSSPCSGASIIQLSSGQSVAPGDLLEFERGLAADEVVPVTTVSVNQTGCTNPTCSANALVELGFSQTAPATGTSVTFGNSHSNGAAVGWAFKVSSGSVNYSTGAVTVTFNPPPASGWTLTVNYRYDGYTHGAGLLDEDGRVAHQTGHGGWLTPDSICVHAYSNNTCPGNSSLHSATTTANFRRDLDGFGLALAAQYSWLYNLGVRGTVSKPGVQHIPIMSDYAVGAAGAPASPSTLAGFSSFVDLLQSDPDFQAAFFTSVADKSARSDLPVWRPDLVGITPGSLDRYNFTAYYLGNKPTVSYRLFSAQNDSSMVNMGVTSQGDYNAPSQVDRAMWFQKSVATATRSTVNGAIQEIGFAWWQPTDQYQGGAGGSFGVLTNNDNAYDGKQSTTSPPSEIVAGIPVIAIPEPSNSGNFLDRASSAIQEVENSWLGISIMKPRMKGQAQIRGAGVMP